MGIKVPFGKALALKNYASAMGCKYMHIKESRMSKITKQLTSITKGITILMVCFFMVASLRSDLYSEPGVGTSFELGYLGMYDQDRMFSTDISIWYNIEMFGIRLAPYGGVKTWFINNDYLIYGGNPFRDSYYVGTKV